MPEPVPVAVLGVDHHRTPVEVRERLAVRPEQVPELARRLLALPGCSEAVVLSTCNRLECYLGGTPSPEAVTAVLAVHGGLEPARLAGHAYWSAGEACVRHLFRVAGGLESLVLGEDQIVAQVKGAYETARGLGLAGPELHPLFQRALAVAKDVRSGTALGRHKMSVASVAVDLARHVHGDLRRARLLILGAGEMAELAVRYLIEQGVEAIGIVNRGTERAMALAGLAREATVYPWEGLRGAIAAHDIVVCSTAAPHLVVMAEDVRQALSGRSSPVVFIDLAVPRDVDPLVADLSDAFLYNIDHLEQVVAGNRRLRQDEIGAAEALVDERVAEHCRTRVGSRAELLAQVAAWFDAQVAAEQERAEDERVRRAVHRLGGRLQHRFMSYLNARHGDASADATVREILGLDP